MKEWKFDQPDHAWMDCKTPEWLIGKYECAQVKCAARIFSADEWANITNYVNDHGEPVNACYWFYKEVLEAK